MKVRQYAYFGVRSHTLDPGTISERLSLLPTDTKLIGSRRWGPPHVPRSHLWRLGSGVESREVPLGEHLDSLLSRLQGSATRIRELVQGDEATARIQVVRNFKPGPEDRHISEPGRYGDDYERLRGQHPLVGFELTPELIAFAAEASIGFDFDEYGDEDE